MSIVADQVRRLDAQIDRIQLHISQAAQEAAALPDLQDEAAPSTQAVHAFSSIARALTVRPSSNPLLQTSSLLELLHRSTAIQSGEGEDGYVTDLEWIVAAKATVQALGLVMKALLDDSMPLNDGIWYWDEVLGSHFYTGLYTVQTMPFRFWQQGQDIFQTVKQHRAESMADLGITSISGHWREFYGIVQQSVQERSLVQAKLRILSPFALSRSKARQKRKQLKKIREINACAIGLLVEEGLIFEIEDDESSSARYVENLGDWKEVVRRTVALMRIVLENVFADNSKVAEFEDNVFAAVEYGVQTVEHPSHIFQQLIHILEESLPAKQTSATAMIKQHGLPSRFVRYWLPGSVLVFSFGTILKILTNRRAELWTWTCELGATVVDFWANWVIDPLKKLIGTIRHDETSEVAIMSKGSLEADRASLERMVVDFALDRSEHPHWEQSEIDTLRAKVKEGDLTPVLKAYERDLRQPFVGTVRGDLVRALLIQIQKTKVDVEIAIGGIDALLKSQELVFGFVGLTPGILVSYATFRWIGGTFGNRAGLRRGRKQEQMTRALRGVDRVLTASSTSPDGILSYKDHGLLICETDVLCQKALDILPGTIYHEFKEDINELLNVRVGVTRQLRILERVRWAYAKWTR
ncbi:Nuclear control of ATPase protein 2 [Emmonsiellopsis sp. PD_33]|nr:Nuclear control of ATPase protein 2 [Emmonsiellopsis sp. PD_33]